MFGNWGKILKINLTTMEIEDWEIEEKLYQDYIGGAGIAAYLFFKLGGYLADPLSPDNPLFILNGPLSGTTLPGCSRVQVCARSPQTGIWGESSMGGHVSPDLKGTGYDGIVFIGASKNPVYLFLDENGAQLRDASHIWGKPTHETDFLLQQEIGDKKVKVISIGPAGENLVKYACVVNDRGSIAGRTGMGAVMGSKKLKAIAIRGRKKINVADEKFFKEVREEAIKHIKKDIFAHGLHLYGTTGGTDISSAINDLPVMNWREAQWNRGRERLSGIRIAETVLAKRHACYACPIACKRIVEIKEGKYQMKEGPGPEYECTSALGSMLRLDDLNAVVKANSLCNAYGLDAISTGSTIAYAIESFKNGFITERDTEGMILDWNQPEQLIELVHNIALRKGFGNELANGSRLMSEKFGGSDFAIQVKGLECPMHDPRTFWSMALSYATSIRGGCHNRDTNLGLEMGMDSLGEVGITEIKPQQRQGKAIQTIYSQAITSVVDSSVICVFAWKGMGSSIRIVRDMLNATTGYGFTLEDLLKIGDRIWYLKRAIGNLCGITREDDQLPKRILSPHIEGSFSGDLLNVVNFLIKINKQFTSKVHNQTILKYYKLLNAKVVLPNTFKTINFVGKLIPSSSHSIFSFFKKKEKVKNRLDIDFQFMLDEYYFLRKINSKGCPEKEVLDDLGLSEVSSVLFVS